MNRGVKEVANKHLERWAYAYHHLSLCEDHEACADTEPHERCQRLHSDRSLTAGGEGARWHG